MKYPTNEIAPDVLSRIHHWRQSDCDPGSVVDLDHLVQSAVRGDEAAMDELLDAFNGTLSFGTAGLRGRMGPGPNRMNAAVVRRTACALAQTAIGSTTGNVSHSAPVVVIGYDARRRSTHFAQETARVMHAAGWRALVLPQALPTPVLAFAVRHLHADLGIMVTASHNPPADNGYKVYLADGRHITSPLDTRIAAAIKNTPAASQIPTSDDWETLDNSIVLSYLDAAVSVVSPSTARDLRIVHTALHGVGSAVFTRALLQAGFDAPEVVAAQSEPDADFPTVAFPNPEEAGAMDLALDLASRSSADLVIAHDPDADRCAVAIPMTGEWRVLTGDEVGALIAWWIIERGDRPRGSFAASLVSGSLVEHIASDAGIPFQRTLTGFKWISRVPGLTFGYEEALGYCVDPEHVADKDGITAGLLLCEMAAQLKVEGRSLAKVLDDLARLFGVFLTAQISVRSTRAADLDAMLDAILAHPPTALAGSTVATVEDLSAGVDGLPPTTGLRINLDDGSRVIIRPSGTEPKVKAYVQVIEPVAGDLALARSSAQERMNMLTHDVRALLGT